MAPSTHRHGGAAHLGLMLVISGVALALVARPGAVAAAPAGTVAIDAATPIPPLQWAQLPAEAFPAAPGVAGGSTPSINDAIFFKGSIVAVGADVAGAASWTSMDGVTWHRKDSPDLDEMAIEKVVVGGDRLVAISHLPHEWGLRVFTSSDGRDWRVVRTSGLYGEGSGSDIAFGPHGYVVVERPGGGVWLSRDAVQWEEQAGLGFTSVVGVPDGYLATGDGLWSSRDGKTWAQVELPVPRPGLSVVRQAGPYLLAFGVSDFSNNPVALVPRDGQRWIRGHESG